MALQVEFFNRIDPNLKFILPTNCRKADYQGAYEAVRVEVRDHRCPDGLGAAG